MIDGFRYSVVNFLDKNKDTLYQDFKRLLYNRYVFSFSIIIVFLHRLQLIWERQERNYRAQKTQY